MALLVFKISSFCQFLPKNRRVPKFSRSDDEERDFRAGRCDEVQKETGYYMVDPHNDFDIMSGAVESCIVFF
jgi:hypothetical protein